MAARSILSREEILSDPRLVEGIRRSRRDLEKGRVHRLQKPGDLWT